MKIECCNGYLKDDIIWCNLIKNTKCHVPKFLLYKGLFYSWEDCKYYNIK